ncbi:hypothetical protein N7537_010168, partial [Penicillium hordei]
SIIELYISKKFIAKIIKFYINIILEDDGNTRNDLDDVAEELKANYKISGIYELYPIKRSNRYGKTTKKSGPKKPRNGLERILKYRDDY